MSLVADLERMRELEIALFENLQDAFTWIAQCSNRTNTEIPNYDGLRFLMRDASKLISEIKGSSYQAYPDMRPKLKQEMPSDALTLPVVTDEHPPEPDDGSHKILPNFASRFFDTGSALILLGFLFIVTGIGYYSAGYKYGLNNLAYAISFMNVGAAYRHRRIISGLAAAISAFQMVLISTGYIPNVLGLISSAFLFAIICGDYIFDRGKQELVKVGPRMKYWLGIHLHIFAFLGLMHFPFLYFFIRLPYGTSETYFSVIVFQLQTLFIGLLGIYEKAKPKLWGIDVPKIGFAYIIFVILTGLILESQTYLLITVTAIIAFYAYSLGLPRKFADKFTHPGIPLRSGLIKNRYTRNRDSSFGARGP